MPASARPSASACITFIRKAAVYKYAIARMAEISGQSWRAQISRRHDRLAGAAQATAHHRSTAERMGMSMDK